MNEMSLSPDPLSKHTTTAAMAATPTGHTRPHTVHSFPSPEVVKLPPTPQFTDGQLDQTNLSTLNLSLIHVTPLPLRTCRDFCPKPSALDNNAPFTFTRLDVPRDVTRAAAVHSHPAPPASPFNHTTGTHNTPARASTPFPHGEGHSLSQKDECPYQGDIIPPLSGHPSSFCTSSTLDSTHSRPTLLDSTLSTIDGDGPQDPHLTEHTSSGPPTYQDTLGDLSKLSTSVITPPGYICHPKPSLSLVGAGDTHTISSPHCIITIGDPQEFTPDSHPNSGLQATKDEGTCHTIVHEDPHQSAPDLNPNTGSQTSTDGDTDYTTPAVDTPLPLRANIQDPPDSLKSLEFRKDPLDSLKGLDLNKDPGIHSLGSQHPSLTGSVSPSETQSHLQPQTQPHTQTDFQSVPHHSTIPLYHSSTPLYPPRQDFRNQNIVFQDPAVVGDPHPIHPPSRPAHTSWGEGLTTQCSPSSLWSQPSFQLNYPQTDFSPIFLPPIVHSSTPVPGRGLPEWGLES